MRRREFMAGAGGIAVAWLAWPIIAVPQSVDRVRRIGVLVPYPETDAPAQRQLAAFREGLGRLGWNEGKNIRFEYRWAGGNLDRLRDYSKALVALQPDVILARSTPTVAALLRETRTIPIVFVVVSDPLGDGFVANLAKPGGNVTGFTNVEASLGGKWVELLKEIDPRVARVGILFDPQTAPAHGDFYEPLIRTAAASIGLTVETLPVHNATEIDQAFVGFARRPNGGLVVPPDITTANNRWGIAAAAAKHRLVAVYGSSYYADDGGLIAYGVEYNDLYRRSASYVDRILRGAKASDLPVQAPAAFELVINQKTAKAIGVDIPKKISFRADRVIE